MKEKNKFFGRDKFNNSVIVKSDKDITGKIKIFIITNFNQNTLFGKNFDQSNKMQLKMSEITKLDQTYILKRIDEETINIQINNNEMLISIVGQFNQNLNDLSKH